MGLHKKKEAILKTKFQKISKEKDIALDRARSILDSDIPTDLKIDGILHLFDRLQRNEKNSRISLYCELVDDLN